jgi:trimeric autotransporter adhesin
MSDYLMIKGNTVVGGYTGIQLSGKDFASSSTDSTEKLRYPTIWNNTIQDFYAFGIGLNYTHGAVLSGNSISRPTRTNSGTDSQTPAGISILSGSVDFKVEKNRIFDFAGGGGDAFTSIARGIYVSGTGTALTSGTIQNNLIYGLDNDHSANGMQINSWSALPINIYHNTVVFDQSSGTTVSPPSGYHTNAINFGGGTTAQSNINVMNNIFFLRRDGDISKRIYRFSNDNSTINSNYNVYFIDGLTQGVTEFAAYGTSPTYADLAAWQATGQDANSIVADPQFTDPSTGNFLPTNASIIGSALNTPDVGVIDDILGLIRNTNPDPGAYEMDPCTLPVAGFSASQTELDVTFTNSTTGATTYWWDFGNGDTSVTQSPSYSYATAGTYTVTMIAGNDCGLDTATQEVTVIVGVEELGNNFNAVLFPNPSNGAFTLSFSIYETQQLQIDLVDVTGRVLNAVANKTFIAGNHSLLLNANDVSNGMYSLVVRSENGMVTVPIAIVR